jgi:outer membrane receptor protein involved in Fe transport
VRPTTGATSSSTASAARVPTPNYTDDYGQLDLNISYAVSDQLSLSLEAINLTDETMRTYARHTNMLRYATQTGPRYMFGVRYKF